MYRYEEHMFKNKVHKNQDGIYETIYTLTCVLGSESNLLLLLKQYIFSGWSSLLILHATCKSLLRLRKVVDREFILQNDWLNQEQDYLRMTEIENFQCQI